MQVDDYCLLPSRLVLEIFKLMTLVMNSRLWQNNKQAGTSAKFDVSA